MLAALRNQFGGHAVEHERSRGERWRPRTTRSADEENPLVEGLERQPVHPTTLVIFGATGDLAQRKLLPAIYNLAHEGALPERFNLIGVSRGEQSDEEFREEARGGDPQFSRREPDENVLDALLEQFRYVTGTFDDADMYERLGKTLDEFDDEAGQRVQPRSSTSRPRRSSSR